MKNKRMLAGAAAVLVAAGLLWLGLGAGKSDAASYRTGKIERSPLQATVSASGTVNPVTQVSVGTQVSGQIKELFVDFNSEVKAGQLIALIDPETFEYRVRQAQADGDAARATVLTAEANAAASRAAVSRAQTDVVEAQRTHERNVNLAAQGFISQSEVDRTRALVNTLGESVKSAQAQLGVSMAQIKSAQASVAQRDAALAQARIDLERTKITSPVSGIVIKRTIEKGQTVAASLQAPELFVIAQNLRDMQVDASIDEADVGRIRSGQKASFTVDAFAGQTFEGEVRQVRKAAQNVASVVTYVAVVGFSNVGDRLLPGMTANVRIVTESRPSALKVPNAALRVRIAGVEAAPEAAPSGSASTTNTVASGAGNTLATGQNDLKKSENNRSGGSGGGSGGGGGGGGAGGGGAGGQGTEFRNRVVAELQLSAEQIEKVDAIYAAVRPQFAGLRELPEQERGKARERLTGDIRARIGYVLTPEQKPKFANLVAEASGRQSTRGRIYLLDEDGKPRALNVRLGISDGTSTELVVGPNSPQAADLKEGAVVVVGVQTTGAAAPGGARPAAGPRLPF
ncbi:MAG: efflux RND transporter periplasmic adaptor subunit [Burkholderiaceae bacterium]